MFAALKALIRHTGIGTSSPVLAPETIASRDKTTCADRRTWTFEWTAEALSRQQPATIEGFARWLHEIEETDLSRRRLCSLWWEYIEVHDLRPISWPQFDRGLKAAGVTRYRSSRPGRPWLYRVTKPQTAIVYRLTRHAA